MDITITLYKDAGYTDSYSQDGAQDDPIWPRSGFTWSGQDGETRDIQVFARNDGDVPGFQIVIEVVDIAESDETTWSKVAATQAGLAGAPAGNSINIGDLAVGDTTNFWLRVTVPPGTDPQDKIDLRVRATASMSSSSSQSSSCSSSSSQSSLSSSSSSESSSSSSDSSESSSSSTEASIIESKHARIDNPDGITDTEILLLDVDSLMYPNGVTVLQVKGKLNPAGNYVITFENRTDPADAAPTTIETLSISAAREAESSDIDNPSVAAGNLIYADLPATDADSIDAIVRFTVD